MAKIYVQKGKAVTSLKGILKEGTEVFEKYFKTGEKAITELTKAGIIGTNSKPIIENISKTGIKKQ